MGRRLLISVRFLDGRYHGQGQWPPSPARLFQALVAGAALGNALPERVRGALGWFETLDPPVIAAPAARRAKAVKLWVPNNDADAKLGSTKGGYAEAVAAVRSAKEESPWLFDASVPLIYAWDMPDNTDVPEGLLDAVLSLYRLGRGTDPAFASIDLLPDEAAERLLADYPGALHRPGPGDSHDVPCQGTLASLERRHAAFTGRFSKVRGQLAFRQPPKARTRLIGYDAPTRTLLYHLRNTETGAFHPVPLTQAFPIADLILTQAAGRLSNAQPEKAGLIARQLLGKEACNAEKAERIRLIPLPSAGHAEVDPSIRRVLIEVPGNCPVPLRDLDWAFGTLTPHDAETGEVLGWRLERADSRDTVMAHYRPEQGSRRWRSVTPVILSVSGSGRSGAQRRDKLDAAAGAVRQALRHAGIRTPVQEVRLQSEPLRCRGDRSDKFALPPRFGRQHCTHVEIVFVEPVAGPLLIGNGRYRGLGLLEPVRDMDSRLLFDLAGDGPLDAVAVAAAARRAVMARVQNQLGNRELPMLFTGHDTDGSPARTGRRAHLAVLVDPVARQALIAMPWHLDRREPDNDERRHVATLERALAGFDMLRAGRAGAFSVSRAVGHDGPLLATATLWQSATDWTPCRHGKGDPSDWIARDIAAECRLRNLPEPSEVNVLERHVGARGSLRARLRITFPVAVSGPVALGRTAMKGGGVFLAVE